MVFLLLFNYHLYHNKIKSFALSNVRYFLHIMFTYYENQSSKFISIPQYTVQNVERLEGVNTYAAVITMEEISYHVKETERKWKEKVSEY